MPSIYSVLDKCPVPFGAHLVSGHVKKGNAAFDAKKSFFTDTSGTEIGADDAIKFLVKAKDTAAALAFQKRDEAKSITSVAKKIQAINTDQGKIGYAVTWGEQVGKDGEDACTWVCMVVTSNLTGGRHQWVTAHPATDDYVTRKKVA